MRRWLDDDPYPRAEVEVIAEPKKVAADAMTRRDAVERLLVRTLAMRAELGDRTPPVDAAQLDADPLRASFEAAAIAPVGPLDAQRLLELDDPVERLTLLEQALTDEIQVLEFRLGQG